MTPEQLQNLRQSFEDLMPLPNGFGAAFYERLFALDPSLRSLFRGNLEEQATMFANALTLAMMNMSNDGRLSRAVGELGGRHGRYGVRPEHYETFGTALIDTVAERLGDRFSPATRLAWQEAYRMLAAAMVAAAERSRQD